ncbi:hypothetical protein Tco_0532324 [Tanacetum coccineum]
MERKGVPMAKGRDDQKGSAPHVGCQHDTCKLANGTWKVKVDYSSINKVCAKDMYPFLKEGEGLASIMGYPYKCFLRLLKDYSQIRMTEDDEEKTGIHTEEGVYYFTHMPKELKNSADTLQKMMKKLDLVQDVEEILRKLKRVNIKIDPVTSLFRVKEGRFFGYMVTNEGVRADPKKVQAIILSLTPKSPNQIRSLFLQLTAISKFIPKMAELQYLIRKVRMRFKTTEESGWMNEAEEALQRIKRKLNKLQTLDVLIEDEILMLCLRQKDETISSVLLVEREGIQIPVSYVSRPLQGMEICYTPTEKIEILKLSEKEGRLAKWAAEIRTYDISYIQRKEAEGSIVKKFFGQGEQVQETLDANEGGTFNLNKKLQEKSTPTPRAQRLAASLSKCMKDLHVSMDSPKLVAQTEGNHTPATEQERKYKKEIIDATTPFHSYYCWFKITAVGEKVNVQKDSYKYAKSKAAYNAFQEGIAQGGKSAAKKKKNPEKSAAKAKRPRR